MVGYFQSKKYFEDNEDIIRRELQVKDNLAGKNKKLYDEINKNNSVCLHIRRGDYVNTFFEVCTKDYYLEAINIMNKKVNNAKYYIFSDDINWAKDNIKIDNATYVDWNNNQYEESCFSGLGGHRGVCVCG